MSRFRRRILGWEEFGGFFPAPDPAASTGVPAEEVFGAEAEPVGSMVLLVDAARRGTAVSCYRPYDLIGISMIGGEAPESTKTQYFKIRPVPH